MKTPEQKAADYCRNTHGICATCKKVKKCDIEEQIGNCKSKYPYYFAFLAGYNAANEWISVDYEFPEIKNDGYWIIGKDKDDIHYALYIDSIVEHEEINGIGITHWKQI